jgi:hypothetical protein
VWNRFAQSFFYKIDRSTQKLTAGRIHYFDIHYSIFAFSEFLFPFDWPLFWPAAPSQYPALHACMPTVHFTNFQYK